MIEPPRPEEKKKLVALAQATGFFNIEEIAVVGEMLDEFWSDGEASGYHWLVYRERTGSAPLGFACYGPVSMSEDVYDLYWIAVDPAHQSQHLGSALLRQVEEEVKRRNARQLYIETSDTPQYDPTRAFYLRRGYEEVAHFSDFYHVGDGKVVYRRIFREK